MICLIRDCFIFLLWRESEGRSEYSEQPRFALYWFDFGLKDSEYFWLISVSMKLLSTNCLLKVLWMFISLAMKTEEIHSSFSGVYSSYLWPLPPKMASKFGRYLERKSSVSGVDCFFWKIFSLNNKMWILLFCF